MEKFGNWQLTPEWIESENARIPLDSISYVGSLDLMKRIRVFLLLGAIFFGFVTLAFLFSAYIQGALISGGLCALLLYLYNQNSTTFVVISHSGFMIQQTTGRIVKGDAEYQRFMDLLFNYRNNFIGFNQKTISVAQPQPSTLQTTQVKPSTSINPTIQPSNVKREQPVNPNATCPVCNSLVKQTDYDCWSCHTVFAGNSNHKPIPKVN